jgi:hypothetical protein
MSIISIFMLTIFFENNEVENIIVSYEMHLPTLYF